jgi:hypothetical protein
MLFKSTAFVCKVKTAVHILMYVYCTQCAVYKGGQETVVIKSERSEEELFSPVFLCV